MDVKSIFWNELHELKAGWQLAVFVLTLAGAGIVFIVPLGAFFDGHDAMPLNAAVLAAALVATWMTTRFVNKKPFVAVGLAVNAHTMRELVLGCLLGWLMLTAIFGIEYLSNDVKVAAAEVTFAEGLQMFVTALIFFALAAMAEEVLFRGYPFQTLARGIGVVPAMVLMSALFGAAHLRNPHASFFAFLNTVLVSAVLCLAYWRTRGLWLPFGIHLGWNFSQTVLYGFPTSGHHFAQFELTRLTQFGAEWTTGGEYGPEGGALATVTIVLCGVYLYYARSLRPHPGVVTLEREDEAVRFPLLPPRGTA